MSEHGSQLKRRVIHSIKSMLSFGLISLLVLCSSPERVSDSARQDITIELARNILMQEVLNNSIDGKTVYELPEKLVAGDFIINEADSIEYPVTEYTWFFFIDDTPDGRFAKPVRFVFISGVNGTVEIVDENWMPNIFGDMEQIFNDKITLQKAQEILLNEILDNDVTGKSVWVLKKKLEAGSSVFSSNDSTLYPVTADSWFFFIDDMTEGKYAKPVRYVFIRSVGGTYQIFDEQWYPNVFIAMVPLFGTGELSLKQVEYILLNEILFNDIEYRVVLEYPPKLEAGNKIYNEYDSTEFVMETPGWFFMIDDYPQVLYTKPVRYVFIHSTDGSYEIHEQGWWPNVFREMIKIFGTGELPLKDAEKRLLEKILSGSVGNTLVLELPEKLFAGSVVRNDLDKTEYPVDQNSWFFLIDDLPFVFYTKPVRYVLMHSSDTTFEIIEETWWPERMESLVQVEFN